MKDRLGTEIKVGDRVVWGAGGRRMFGLRVGEVLEILPGSPKEYVKCKTTETGYRGGCFFGTQVVVVKP